MLGLGIGTGIQALLGAGQLIGGLLSKPKRPKYNIPGAVGEATANARRMANANVRPGNDQALQVIDRNATNGIQTAKSLSGSASQVLDFASKANNERLRALGQNNAMNSQFAFNSRMNLQGQLGRHAQYEDKAFQLNKLDPYSQRAQLKSSLIGSGLQNLWGAAEAKSFQDMYKSIYGGGGSVGMGGAV
jgi:hypothetical protein